MLAMICGTWIVWDQAELEQCRRLLYAETVSAADMMQRWEKWGGIPRYVLEKLDPSQHNMLDYAISGCTLDTVRKCLGLLFPGADLSSMVLHLRVAEDFITTHVDWASTWVAQQVAYRLWCYKHGDLQNCLSSSASFAEASGLHGQLWQGLWHNRMAAGGQYKTRCSKGGAAEEKLQMDAATTQHVVDTKARSRRKRTHVQQTSGEEQSGH